MKVAVTGAGSRLGLAVIPQLCQSPNISEVVGIGRRHFPPISHPKLSIHRADIRDASIVNALDGAHVLIHMAFAVIRKATTAQEMFDNNVNGSRNVFDAARAAGVEKIVNVSSVSVYGKGNDLPENAPFAPSAQFPYACHKVAVEKMLANEFGDICSVQLRPTFILGPHTIPVLRKLFTSRVYVRPRKPFPLIQVIHEEDVASAILAALDPAIKSDSFNLAAPEAVTIPELVRNSRRLVFGVPIAVVERLAGAPRDGAADVRAIDTSLELLRTSLTVCTDHARKVLRWAPRFGAWEARAACDRNPASRSARR